MGVKHLLKAPAFRFFDCGGVTLLLSLADSTTSIIYFEVDDIQKAFETLKSRGVKMEEKPTSLGSLAKWMSGLRSSAIQKRNLMSLRSMTLAAKAQ